MSYIENYFECKEISYMPIDNEKLYVKKSLNGEKYKEFLENNIIDLKFEVQEVNHINILYSSFSCHNDVVPSIDYDSYIKRIMKHSRFSIYILILSMLYIRYILYNFPNFTITPSNRYRLMACSMFVAHIHLEDDYLTYGEYSRVIGIQKNELVELVRKFLILIDFKVMSFDKLVDKYRDDFKV
tara:strand:+ start:5569 stop:6120 length:552 start_codon:yes stop_codon:yes gene_type:complete